MSNVHVAVRARPLFQRELDLKSPVIVEMKEKSTTLFKSRAGVAVGDVKDASIGFQYDFSYWSVDTSDTHFVTQEQVFNDLGKSVLNSAFEGYNACVFAYGQTGSGKTYTMMGSESAPGLIPRICERLFVKTATGNLKNVSYQVEASYMEIYNEKVRDLLSSSGSANTTHALRVREHPKFGPYVESLSKHNVSSYEAIHKLIEIGNSRRVTASTMMNDVSSRSHAIFTITFTQATYSSDLPCETVSKINLVDLAGSERASATGAEGIRLKEGGSINKSLVCLGNVISALADHSSQSGRHKKPYIPYRDSVLTWLLKDSLGGNSKTIMIATISPAACNYGETLSTLRYASRAKNIVNKPTINEDPNVKLIRELRVEIKRLKRIIEKANLESGEDSLTESAMMTADIHKKEEQIEALTRNWAVKWKDLEKIIEDRRVALSSEGIKMSLVSAQPHLISVDSLETGVVLYHLQGGATTIGRKGAVPEPDIGLEADDISVRHCVIHNTDGEVGIECCEGLCYLNEQLVSQPAPSPLSHGDMIQLGNSVLFRFNHPQNYNLQKADTVERRKPLVPSSWSPASDLIKKNLEKEYSEKMRTLQRELEKKSEEEKLELQTELHLLRKAQLKAPDSEPESSEDLSDLENDPYNIMRSIAFVPVSPLTRVVIGKEATTDLEVTHTEEATSCIPDYTAFRSPEVVGTHAEYKAESNGYVGERRMTGNDPQTPLRWKGSTESIHKQLSEERRRNISVVRRLKTSEENRAQAEQKSEDLMSLYEFEQQKHEAEQELLRKKVEELQVNLQKQDSLGESRRRSYAFGEKDKPKRPYRKRSRSVARHHSGLSIEIPSYHLRGQGFTSYHVYDIKIELGREVWHEYRSYRDFCVFHDSMKLHHSELPMSVLTLPPSKWFGYKSPEFVEKRKMDLQTYLQSFLAVCQTVSVCILSEHSEKTLTRQSLEKFSRFFSTGQVCTDT